MAEIEPPHTSNRDLIRHAFESIRFGRVGEEPAQISEFQNRREDGLRAAEYLDDKRVSLQPQLEQEEPRFYADIRQGGIKNSVKTLVVLIDADAAGTTKEIVRQKTIGNGPFSDRRVERKHSRFEKMARRLNSPPKP